jgi:hypothetical protein
MAGELKNLDTGKARVLLFPNFGFYMHRYKYIVDCLDFR